MIGRTNFTNCDNFERFHRSKLKKIKGQSQITTGERLPSWSLSLITKIILILFTTANDSPNIKKIKTRIFQKNITLARAQVPKSYGKHVSVRIKHFGKWKFSTPLQILHAVRRSGGMHKNALFKGRSTLVVMVTTAACSGLFISLSQAKYNITLLPYIVTSYFFTMINSIFPGSECEHTNRLFVPVQFRSFLLSGKTGKTFIWISPKLHKFWNWNYPPSWL